MASSRHVTLLTEPSFSYHRTSRAQRGGERDGERQAGPKRKSLPAQPIKSRKGPDESLRTNTLVSTLSNQRLLFNLTLFHSTHRKLKQDKGAHASTKRVGTGRALFRLVRACGASLYTTSMHRNTPTKTLVPKTAQTTTLYRGILGTSPGVHKASVASNNRRSGGGSYNSSKSHSTRTVYDVPRRLDASTPNPRY